MALRAEEAEAALIQSVCSRLRDHTAPELVDLCEAFVRQFYHWVAWRISPSAAPVTSTAR